MKFIRAFIFTPLLMLFSGCAYLHSFDENLPQQIDIWINDEYYGKALNTLDYIDQQHKDYSHLMHQREKLLQLAAQLENRILKEGKKHLAKKQWHEAQKSYEYGLGRLPDSRPIQKAHEQFLDKRATYLKKLKLKLLKNKTSWLLDDKQIREEIAAVIPRNYQARWILQDHNADINSTTHTLLECVDDSIETGELDMARQCLGIARQLNPATPLLEKINTAEQELGLEVLARSQHLTNTGEKSLRQAKQALAEGDYAKVKNLLDRLSIQDKKNQLVLNFRKQSDIQLDDYIANRIREGRSLYSKGEIQQAYLMWKSLLPLEPNNKQLQQLIKRAQQILNKLRQIENNPDQIVKPPGNRAGQ